eukprot:15470720-Alexandrium_andersonii.AAC.1
MSCEEARLSPERGIKPGDPTSSTIFAVVFDLCVRMLARAVGAKGWAGALADDLALCSPSLFQDISFVLGLLAV